MMAAYEAVESTALDATAFLKKGGLHDFFLLFSLRKGLESR